MNDKRFKRPEQVAIISTFRAMLVAVLFAAGCFCGMKADAQELNCKVTVLHDKITGVDAQVFNSMQKSLNEFINSQKWTDVEYAPIEKIEVNIMFNLSANNVGGDPDAYSGTMSIQATRPVFNAGYTTTIINYVDKDIQFKYTQFNPLHFEENQGSGSDPMVSNLTALLAYYSYLVIGLDNDSFSPEGGSGEFKKAQNVVNNSPESGKAISGWKPVESTRNRYWLTDQILSTRFADLRGVWYSMHREGLDSMYTKPSESRTRIMNGMKKLSQLNKENPSSLLIQFFFNAKSDEILHLLAAMPKTDRGPYITLLNAMDVPNAAKYNSLK
jgi:Domain of unknown function (DUF4835)